MKTFHEWLNEIAYTGDIEAYPTPSLRKKLNIIPSNEDEGVIELDLDANFLDTILDSSLSDLIKPIPEKIHSIFQKAKDNDNFVKLSAGDIYDLKKFLEGVNKFIIYQQITSPEIFQKEGIIMKSGAKKILKSLKFTTFA